MIYTKKANFPYPVLMNFSNDYLEDEFEFDVQLKDDIDEYILEVEWKMSSTFIEDKINRDKADVILIVKSKDNQFYILGKNKNDVKKIKRSRLCLSSRTVMQLMVVAKEEISFEDNEDLNEFYDDSKAEIVVKAGQVLAFSNTVIFDGSQDKPYELFEKRVDENLDSDIEIKLCDETIMIVYKSAELQFTDLANRREYNYPYIYLGLQKALSMFLVHNALESAEDGVDLEEIDPPENALEAKLYSLMIAKNVSELNWDNMDEVIYKISDNIVRRYSDAIRRTVNGD